MIFFNVRSAQRGSNYFAIAVPANTAISPNAMLSTMYIIMILYEPESMSLMFSAAKAENVVKPPQNPASMNNFKSWLIQSYFAASPMTSPIMKQPAILAASVPKKNAEEKSRDAIKKVP